MRHPRVSVCPCKNTCGSVAPSKNGCIAGLGTQANENTACLCKRARKSRYAWVIPRVRLHQCQTRAQCMDGSMKLSKDSLPQKKFRLKCSLFAARSGQRARGHCDSAFPRHPAPGGATENARTGCKQKWPQVKEDQGARSSTLRLRKHRSARTQNLRKTTRFRCQGLPGAAAQLRRLEPGYSGRSGHPTWATFSCRLQGLGFEVHRRGSRLENEAAPKFDNTIRFAT